MEGEDDQDRDLDWPEGDGPEPAPLTVEERRRWCSFLVSNVEHHVSIPVSLGLGCTDLASKVEASLYAFMWECSCYRALRAVCKSFCTFTTDMGTEMGMSGFRGSLKQMLPSWSSLVAQDEFVPDDGRESSGSEDDDGGFVFPHALPIPGMCHTWNNLSEDLDKRLSWWPNFWQLLQNVAGLFGNAQRR